MRSSYRPLFALFVLGVGVVGGISAAGLAAAAAPQATAELNLPEDRRLGPLVNLDSYFPFDVPESPEAWNERAEEVRQRMRVALGLWPEPTRTPTNAVVYGKVDRPDFTVERVFLESYPGHFVTGSLFRPKNKTGKLPGVLCPHGHWANGRFYDAGRGTVRKQIVEGAERFEVAGRFPLQARCVQLARMGCVVFHYDMVGVADSQQIPGSISHGFDKRRPQMEGADAWGFFSPQAELRQQSIMGLQTWNSIRALDWFTTLDDVDPARIAVTGASGGGTQTFILCGLDPRPAVAFPAVMVSTAMQGGCTCENASHLRVGTGNVEFAGLFAPKPLGMTAADDWTREIATKGMPELNKLYAMLGAEGNVMARPLLHFGHNYNYVSRAVMYSWLNKHLGLGFEDPIVEEDFEPLSVAELTVWGDEHPAPPGGEDHERALLRWQADDAARQIAARHPQDDASRAEYQRVVGGGWNVLIGRKLADNGDIEYEQLDKIDRDGYLEMPSRLHNRRFREEVPVVFLHPKVEWNNQVVIWIDERGKAGLYDSGNQLRAEVRELLNDGAAVVGVDLLYQGDFNGGAAAPTRQRRVENDRDFIGYTLGYNPSLFSRRVHDILTVVSFVRNHPEHRPQLVDLVGLDGAGPWVAAARLQAGKAVTRSAVDTAGFRFAKLTETDDVNFVPGAVKYDDLPGLLAAGAPGALWLAGEGIEGIELVRDAQQAGDQRVGHYMVYHADEEGEARDAVEWLLK